VVTEAEAAVYREKVTKEVPIHAIGNGVDFDYWHEMPDEDTKRLLFVGVLNYKPNADGVIWFCNRRTTSVVDSEPLGLYLSCNVKSISP